MASNTQLYAHNTLPSIHSVSKRLPTIKTIQSTLRQQSTFFAQCIAPIFIKRGDGTNFVAANARPALAWPIPSLARYYTNACCANGHTHNCAACLKPVSSQILACMRAFYPRSLLLCNPASLRAAIQPATRPTAFPPFFPRGHVTTAIQKAIKG